MPSTARRHEAYEDVSLDAVLALTPDWTDVELTFLDAECVDCADRLHSACSSYGRRFVSAGRRE
jgi:hypothetical protein